MTSSGRPPVALVDRSTLERAAPTLLADALADPCTRVVDLLDGLAPVVERDGGVGLALRGPEPADRDRDVYFLGRIDETGQAVLAVASTPPKTDAEPDAGPRGDATPPAAGSPGTPSNRRSLRDVGALLDDRDADLYLTALALANWHRTHGHCPRCGAPTRIVHGGWVRQCDADSSQHYPRTDPAVIMAVVDEQDRLLLARNPSWPLGRRSVLAGFVEPGERLEAAVVREVAEEVGVAVHDVVYADSQPWPFPASLMLGFTARATDGELRLQADEIAEAQWYTRADLAAAVADGSLGLPGRLSIARRLIEGWFGDVITPPAEVSFAAPPPASAVTASTPRPSAGRST